MRHGPADIHAGAANRRAFRDPVLLVSGSRFDEARRIREDQSRDDCVLHGTFVGKHHREQEGAHAGSVSAPAGWCKLATAPARYPPSPETFPLRYFADDMGFEL